MKKKNILSIIVVSLLIILFIIVLSFFYEKNYEIELKNKSNKLLEKFYLLNTNKYDYNQQLFESLELNKDYYIDGLGEIEVDKYGNVRFLIQHNNYCISKTYMGNTKVEKNKCNNFEDVYVEIIKNNKTISFSSFDDKLEYKISRKDDFVGEWIKKDYTGNIIIDKYYDGINYIWFKDFKGNISEVNTFEPDCFNSNGANYNKDLFYCTGSTVKLNSLEWIVIEDNKKEISLMAAKPLDYKIAHCLIEEGKNCYKTGNKKLNYLWSNSYINEYLNEKFYEALNEETKKQIKKSYICDDYYSKNCNNENCGGYKKEEIDSKGWECESYTTSNIRIPSFTEYNHLVNKMGKNELLKGNYWLLNSYSVEYGSIVDTNYDVYILEDLITPNEIRPTITLDKTS